MGHVDDFQAGAEAAEQLNEAKARKQREKLAEDFAALPVLATGSLERETKLIDVIDITTGLNVRESLEDVEGLARSIRRVGQLTPLEVRAGDDGWLLVAGHRRHAALSLIADVTGEPVLARCEVVSDASDEDHFVLQLLENDHVPLKQHEWAKGIRILLAKHPDWDAQQIAAAIGKDRRFVQKHLRVLTDLPADVRAKLEAGDLSFRIADILRKAAKDGVITEDQASELADDVASGTKTVGEVEQVAVPAKKHQSAAADSSADVVDDLDDWGEENDADVPWADGGTPVASPDGDPRPWQNTGLVEQADGDVTLPVIYAQIESYLIGRLLNEDPAISVAVGVEGDPVAWAENLGAGDRMAALRRVAQQLLKADPQAAAKFPDAADAVL